MRSRDFASRALPGSDPESGAAERNEPRPLVASRQRALPTALEYWIDAEARPRLFELDAQALVYAVTVTSCAVLASLTLEYVNHYLESVEDPPRGPDHQPLARNELVIAARRPFRGGAVRASERQAGYVTTIT